MKLLLDIDKMSPDLKDKEGRTPLSWAAEKGHEAVVDLLLGTGKVDTDSKDSYSKTPLLRATAYRHEAVMKLLQSSIPYTGDSELSPL